MRKLPFRNFLILSGEGGIRTPGASQLNGFQDRRNRPLCHLSGHKSRKDNWFYQIFFTFFLFNRVKPFIFSTFFYFLFAEYLFIYYIIIGIMRYIAYGYI